MRFASLFCFFLLACGGATDDSSEPSSSGPTTSTPSQSPSQSDDSTGPNDSQKTQLGASECSAPATVIAKSGTTIRQPVGSVQRFQLVYQGTEIGVSALRGVDMVIAGSDGPFAAGTSSGYWAEVRDASGNTTYTRLLQDPTRQEAPAGNGGGFSNATLDKCIAKTILVDIPRSPSGSVLVLFGSAYGTQGVAGELARFTLE